MTDRHPPLDTRLPAMLRSGTRLRGVFNGIPSPALVRCLEHDIARTLDLGAGGLQIPMVNTAQQAASLVQRVKYPLPTGAPGLPGQRGSAFSSRAAGYGAFGGPEHTRRSNPLRPAASAT